jgi:hypothetical protein
VVFLGAANPQETEGDEDEDQGQEPKDA